MKVTKHQIFRRGQSACLINRWVSLALFGGDHRILPCFRQRTPAYFQGLPIQDWAQAVWLCICATRQNQHVGGKSQPKILRVPQVFEALTENLDRPPHVRVPASVHEVFVYNRTEYHESSL